MKYRVLKLIKHKIPFSNKVVVKAEQVYPYSMRHLGHAKACARMLSASIMYTDLHNKVINFIVQNSLHETVFVAREHVNGVYGQDYEDLEK